jgi:hypothetical protein
LADGALRAALEDLLVQAGRVLLEVGGGFLSGYDDGVAERLVQEGVGVLPPDDRAVLTLVVLQTVAIPRARGAIPADADWSVAEPVERIRLRDSRLPERTIGGALRRLRDAGILRPGQRPSIAPGPQFTRLTPAASASLFEELILLCEPDGALAEAIRRRRAARTAAREDPNS